MTLLPSHGFTSGVLLLAHAARVPRTDIDVWVRAASDRAAHWGRSLDLPATARALLEHGLADQTQDGISPAQRLLALASMKFNAMQAAARILLAVSPPPWLAQAVRTDAVVRDYIPDADLKALAWLEPGLDALLIDVAALHRTSQEDVWRARLGEAAEGVVLSALQNEGRTAVQVSLISASYGYDIEVCGSPTERIEVKGAGPGTAGSFHLTRHEFETALHYPNSFSVIQVVFRSHAFSADVLRPEHIAGMIRLTPQALRSTVPEDTEMFTWEQSALLTPPRAVWSSVGLRLAEDFAAPGLRRPGGASGIQH
jgi:hypothetical protein